MRFHREAAVLFIALLTAIPCFAAEIVRGNWEKVKLLKPGAGIIVKLKAGDAMEATYQAMDEKELRIKDTGGSELSLPKQSILSIETGEKVIHNLRKGAILGAVVGAPVGIVAAVIAHSAFAGGTAAWSSRDKQMVAAGGLITGGIGAGVGMLVSSRTKQSELLYMAD
jgi:hypothetical protein